MAQLSSGTTATITLAAGKTLQIVPAVGAIATVRPLTAAPGSPSSEYRLTNPLETSYGPYGSDAQIKIASEVGVVTYFQKRSNSTPKVVYVDSADLPTLPYQGAESFVVVADVTGLPFATWSGTAYAVTAAAATLGTLGTQQLSAVGLGASISTTGVADGGTCKYSFGVPTGTVNSVGIQIQDAANAANILGYAYYPEGSGRPFTKPAGVSAIKLNVISFIGTGSLPCTISG